MDQFNNYNLLTILGAVVLIFIVFKICEYNKYKLRLFSEAVADLKKEGDLEKNIKLLYVYFAIDGIIIRKIKEKIFKSDSKPDSETNK